MRVYVKSLQVGYIYIVIHSQKESMLRGFQSNIQILRNGHLVSRACDYIIYSVEAAAIDRVVAEYGPCMVSSCI